ncbi:ATPase, F1/V1/A1 complex, alpha/beta subunit [Tanacetum coccineum]
MSKVVKTTDTCVNAGIAIENFCMASNNMNDPGPNVSLGSNPKLTGSNKVHVSVLNNDEKVVGADVAIPVAVVDEISEKFANTLYGYFIGERLAFPTVEAYVKNAWVKIHNVPVVAFSETGLSLITTQLGRPIRLDACTSDMCLNPWGRNSYARVLVELFSECVVMESIVVAIPLPKGEGHYLETLDVEYEWWPPQCSKCKVFDHEDDYCLIKVKKANSDPSSGKGSGQDAGFINKKKGGNKAANKKHIHGIRFSKPKSNFMYRPVSKLITTKEIASKHNNNAPSFNKDVNRVDLQPNAPPKVIMDDSYGSTNEHGYFKDDIDLRHKAPMSGTDESDEDEVFMPGVIPGGGFLDDMEDDLDFYDGYEA